MLPTCSVGSGIAPPRSGDDARTKPTPVIDPRPACGRSTWEDRDRSHPSAAYSGGLAAAITVIASGNARSPTTRSSTTRSSAACTAGGAVEISSRNSTPRSCVARLRAHRGGAKMTLPSAITGKPAKSDGSRMDAITVSHGSPSAADIALIAEVLPVPGAPHSNTGTCAATATPSASTVVWVADTHRSYGARRWHEGDRRRPAASRRGGREPGDDRRAHAPRVARPC